MSDNAWQDGDGSWRNFDVSPLTPMHQQLLGSFVKNGYHGSTMRMLANATGLSVPGLYHHFESKHFMLVQLMNLAMDELYARSIAAIEEAGTDLLGRLRLQLECLVLFHAHRGQLAFLAASEIRSLEADARKKMIAARDRQQSLLDSIIEEGTIAGTFRSKAPRDTSRAITTMCTGVAQWFRIDGPESAEDIAHLYVALSESMLAVSV